MVSPRPCSQEITELGQEIGLQVLLPAESVPNVQIPCMAEHAGSGPDYFTLKTPLMTLVQIGRIHLEAAHGKPTPSSGAGAL